MHISSSCSLEKEDEGSAQVESPLHLQSRYHRLNSSQVYLVPAGLTVHHLFASVDPQVKTVKSTTNRANLCINSGFLMMN